MKSLTIILLTFFVRFLCAQPGTNSLLFNLFTLEKKPMVIRDEDSINSYKIKVYSIEKSKKNTVYTSWQTWPPCNEIQKSLPENVCCTGGINYKFVLNFRIVISYSNDSMVLHVRSRTFLNDDIFLDSIIYKPGNYLLDLNNSKIQPSKRKGVYALIPQNTCSSCLYISNPTKGLKNLRKYKKKKN